MFYILGAHSSFVLVGVMGVCLSSLHVFCRLEEGLQLCPEEVWWLALHEYGVLGLLLSTSSSMFLVWVGLQLGNR